MKGLLMPHKINIENDCNGITSHTLKVIPADIAMAAQGCLSSGGRRGAGCIASAPPLQAGPSIRCCTVPAPSLGAASALLCWGCGNSCP